MHAPAWVLITVTMVGTAAVLVGLALYDVRLALIAAGALVAASALLLIDVTSDTDRRD